MPFVHNQTYVNPLVSRQMYAYADATPGTKIYPTQITLSGVLYNYFTFNANTSPSQTAYTLVTPLDVDVEYLLIGGGGGTGGGSNGIAHGGGGGQVLTGLTSITSGSHAILVGKGGQNFNGVSFGVLTNGATSSFNGINAVGGGSGYNNNSSIGSGNNGASGGGGGSTGGSGIPGVGGNGGTGTEGVSGAGGGGGGAAPANGTNGASSIPGNGGNGKQITFANITAYYGGGGRGISYGGTLGTNGLGATNYGGGSFGQPGRVELLIKI